MKTTKDLRSYCLQQIKNGSTLSDDWADLYSVAVLRELEEFVKSGELHRRAELEGKSPNLIMLEIGHELEAPLKAIQERSFSKEQDRLKSEIEGYARTNNVSIPEASAKVNDGSRR